MARLHRVPAASTSRRARAWCVLAALLATTACASGGAGDGASSPSPAPAPAGRVEEGLASWYGAAFQGRRTASGERFDRRKLVAAHPSLPFGTRVRVTRLGTDRSVNVRIVDRGPAAGPRREGVVIDLSEAAAERLGIIRAGRARVRLEVLSSGESHERSRERSRLGERPRRR